jgi:hypothetical protein
MPVSEVFEACFDPECIRPHLHVKEVGDICRTSTYESRYAVVH